MGIYREVDWKVHIMTSPVDDFLTNGVQTLQQQWKKCVDCKEDCGKINLICLLSMRVSWSVYELFSQLMYINIYIYIHTHDLGIKTKTITNLIHNKNNYTHIKSMAGVYDIICLDYSKKICEWNFCDLKKMNLWTHQGFEKRKQ